MSEVFTFVPSYNHASFVERCLKSIFKQTLAPKKLLVIDDGSKDDSPKIIERVLRDCPFPSELIVRENRGLCATLNEGFSHCDTEFFAYLGSDDIWLPNFLAERTKLLEKRESAVLAYGHAFIIDDSDSVIDCSAEWAQYPDGDPMPMLLRGSAPFSPTVIYRRKALENLGWNEKSGLEDYEFYLRLSKKGEFAFDQRILSAWRRHGSNTSSDWQFMLEEILKAQERSANQLCLSDERLAEMQSATKLLYSENFARSGNKKKAFSLLIKNFHKTESASFLLKSFFRILLPMPVLSRYGEMAKRRATMKYGKLKI